MPQLPARPSLEHLRKQAKLRRRDHRIGLARAQHEIAASYGFASWPRLVRYVHATALTGIRRALTLADPDALGTLLDADSSAAVTRLDGVLPLIVLLRDSAGAPPADVRGCAGLLLQAGADPSSAVPSEDGEWELTASYFAVELQDLALLRLLVEAGAAPDDDAFYHACERAGTGFLDVLHQPGFEDMVNHKLDFEDEAGLRWFLDHGVDVNAQGCLHWAIGRGRGTAILRMLIDAGADIDLPHPDVGARPLEAAARCGHLAAYDLLVERGATADLDPVAAAMLAVARGESVVLPAAPPPLPGIPGSDSRWVLGQLALLGRTEVVRALLDAGVPVDSRGWSNFTPLDQAAMHGRVETVRLLIERGADLADCAFDDEGPTPLDAAVWGWRNNRAADGDYEATVALLVAAGAPTRHTPPTGNARIDALLAGQLAQPAG
jgi:ankyrin repeat protein